MVEEILFLNGLTASGCMTTQAEDAAAGAVAAGYRSRVLTFETDTDRAYLSRALEAQVAPLVVDANNRFRLTPGLRKLSLMIDHPLLRQDDLSRADPASAILAWVDESHLEACGTLGLTHRMGFVAHAGPPCYAGVPAMEDREVDLFFSGTLAEPMDAAGWQAANPSVPPPITGLIFDTIALVRAENLPLVEAMQAVGRRLGFDLSGAEAVAGMAAIATVIQGVMETGYRTELLAALPDSLRVVVNAGYLPRALQGRPNLTYIPFTSDFAVVLDVMRKSRIVLNTTLKFPRGAHERIWYGMASGAVVLTDPSSYMERDFTDGQSILILPEGGEVASAGRRVAGLSCDPARLARIAEAARGPYEARHTWHSRIAEIVALAG